MNEDFKLIYNNFRSISEEFCDACQDLHNELGTEESAELLQQAEEFAGEIESWKWLNIFRKGAN